jgi:hypothetical protein
MFSFAFLLSGPTEKTAKIVAPLSLLIFPGYVLAKLVMLIGQSWSIVDIKVLS